MPYGPFQHGWPYSNFHDLNLDWVLQTVKNLATEWAQVQKDWENEQQAFEDFKAYVNDRLSTFQDWFDNLDVQQEINNKIDEMAQNGELLSIIQNTVQNKTQQATDTWLKQNMTPGAGAPALDSSFTLANAAAQSQAVGNKAFLARYADDYTSVPYDLNVLTLPGTYAFSSSQYLNKPSGAPAGYACLIVVKNAYTLNYVNQFFMVDGDNRIWCRYLAVNDNIPAGRDWFLIGNGNVCSQLTPAEGESKIDMNTVTAPGLYASSPYALLNGPNGISTNNTIFVFDKVFTGKYCMQVLMSSNSNYFYCRYFNPKNLQDPSAIDWFIIGNGNVCSQLTPAEGESKIDMNTVTAPGLYASSPYALLNGPNGISTNNTIFVFDKVFTGKYCMQVLMSSNSNYFYCRYFNPKNLQDPGAIDWFIINPDYVHKPWAGKSIACLGDSTTYGDGAGGPSGSWTSYLTDMCGFETVGNYGRNGTCYATRPGVTDSFCERVSTLPDADVYTVMGGINDFNYNIKLGSPGDTAHNTFYGAVDYVISYLLTNHPDAIVVMMVSLPYNSGSYNSHDRRNPEGNSFQDFMDAIEYTAKKYSCPLIPLGYECTYSPFIDAQKSAWTSDGMHPNSLGYERIAKHVIGPYLNNHIAL